MSELLNGPPLRLADVDLVAGVSVDGTRTVPLGVCARLDLETGGTRALVYADGDSVEGVNANALLFMGAARMHRALRALLKASEDPDLLWGEGDARPAEMAACARAESRLTKAEAEARAALAAATYGAAEGAER